MADRSRDPALGAPAGFTCDVAGHRRCERGQGPGRKRTRLLSVRQVIDALRTSRGASSTFGAFGIAQRERVGSGIWPRPQQGSLEGALGIRCSRPRPADQTARRSWPPASPRDAGGAGDFGWSASGTALLVELDVPAQGIESRQVEP